MRNSNKYYIVVICIVLAVALLAYLSVPFIEIATQTPVEDVATSNNASPDEVEKTVKVKENNSDSISEDKSIYDYDHTTVDCLYVTVVEGSETEGTNHSFAEVNSYKNLQGMTGVEKILSNAIVKAGDESGPIEGSLGYTAETANATINVRGRTSTGYDQKSYKIKLHDDAGTWHDQKTIALNKHPADRTRIRNMTYFTLLSQLEHLTSLRTYFVHLYVCDKTSSGDGSDAYEDYGLYTAVEQPNNRFLKRHGLSGGGSLYKANMNEFYRNEDYIKLATDADYDEDKFNEVLEVKNERDHAKLISMLDAVNDYTIPIDDVIDQYFDADNLISYVAFNILMGNPDSNAQNYYLYSPVNSEKWYLLCWDGDASLMYTEYDIMDYQYKEGEWSKGISNYMGVIVFRRMFSEKKYRDMLTQRIEEMNKTVINKENVQKLIDKYVNVVDQYVLKNPDVTQLQCTIAQREQIIESMANDVDLSLEYYYESLEKPMPFYLGDVEIKNDKVKFSWEASYDFSGETITYVIEVATDPSFSEDKIIYSDETHNISSTTDMLEDGNYFYRVVAYNERGIKGTAFDEYAGNGANYDSMKPFTISDNGKKVVTG